MNKRLLQLAESDIIRLDLNRLTRARLLLMSDHWSLDARLDHRKTMAPGRIASLEAKRGRIREAIDRISARMEKLKARKEAKAIN
jgi:hypothetical protein